MQYILTEDEMKSLKQEIADTKKQYEKIINDLCQMVADHKLITQYPGTKEEPTPWGCMYSSEEEWYCDNCPVDKFCTRTKCFSN